MNLMKKSWQPPVQIPVGALLVPKYGKMNEVLQDACFPIYLGWDNNKGGMRLLFPNGIVDTYDAEEILRIFEES